MSADVRTEREKLVEAVAILLHAFDCEDGAPEEETRDDWRSWWNDESAPVNRPHYRARAREVLAAADLLSEEREPERPPGHYVCWCGKVVHGGPGRYGGRTLYETDGDLHECDYEAHADRDPEIMWLNTKPVQGRHAEPMYAVWEDAWVSDGLEHLREEPGWERVEVRRIGPPVEPEEESDV